MGNHRWLGILQKKTVGNYFNINYFYPCQPANDSFQSPVLRSCYPLPASIRHIQHFQTPGLSPRAVAVNTEESARDSASNVRKPEIQPTVQWPVSRDNL